MTLWSKLMQWVGQRTFRLGVPPPVSDPREKEEVSRKLEDVQTRIRFVELKEKNIRRDPD